MMKEKEEKRVPKLRFPEFTDDWEQRKFSDIAARESSIYTSSSDIPSVEYEDVVAEEGRLNKDVRSKEAVKSGIIFDGSQVLYGKLRPYLHNWLNPDFKGIAVGDWWVLKPINTDKNFLYRLIQTQQFDNIANQSSGSKMPRADWNLISDSEFMISLSKEEQSKIGDYFNSLDHLITLHQRKLKNLNVLKKCVMQKLFSQKVRFKADDGSEFPKWKEKRLGDVFTERTERSKGGETLLSVTIAQGIVRQSETDKRNTASENKSNYKIVKRNDLAYNTMRMWQGAEGVSEYDGIVSPAYTVITALDGNNSYFFEILFKQTFMLQIFQRYSQGLTSDTWNLKFPAFSEIKCLVPCEDEQNKIVECVKVLDSVIEKQKATLAAWEELKKGLLQQMFV